jgi:glycosyltransferase involved in cell wall biosynthesis
MKVESVLEISVIFNIFLAIIVAGSFGIWVYLFFVLRKSFELSPKIYANDTLDLEGDLISVIVPARNEEKYIKKCIQSLLDQNIKNYELVLVDDNSTDSTLDLMENFRQDSKVRILKAGEKPSDWVGKNWPCYIGYQNSTGKYLMFTDADTIHSKRSIRDSVATLIKEKLDVITAVPNLKYPNLIVKMVLPVLSVFMFSRYSPMRVNDPNVSIGYLFGSFFVITRESYESVGTHAIVKSEIVEDGALGKKLKEEGYNLRMFRGEDLLEAYWARDFNSLWNSLKRLIIPLYFTDRLNSIIMTIGIFFLMAFPFLVFIYSFVAFYTYLLEKDLSLIILMLLTTLNILSIYCTNFYQLKRANTHKAIYFLGTPIGCFVVSLSFVWSILISDKYAKIKWRGREYNYSKGISC